VISSLIIDWEVRSRRRFWHQNRHRLMNGTSCCTTKSKDVAETNAKDDAYKKSMHYRMSFQVDENDN